MSILLVEYGRNIALYFVFCTENMSILLAVEFVEKKKEDQDQCHSGPYGALLCKRLFLVRNRSETALRLLGFRAFRALICIIMPVLRHASVLHLL